MSSSVRTFAHSVQDGTTRAARDVRDSGVTRTRGNARAAVAILICTYRGEKHIGRQIETIVEQDHHRWCIYVSDDGSDDATLEILRNYQDQLGESRLRVYTGPRKGFAANFFSLIARDEARADYYAFTDQDDEWEPDKLSRSIEMLGSAPATVPAIYGSRSRLIDEEGKEVGFSRPFQRPSGFANALVQNMVSGNTMVLNRAAMGLIRAAGTDVGVSAHDWWAYLLVTGCGGQLLYDPYPSIRYRQHADNLYGANVSLRAMVRRALRLFAGDFREWNEQNLSALKRNSAMLTPECRAQLQLFEAARSASLLTRIFRLWRSGVYRQTWDGQLGLIIAALLKRL
jgi:glycosyltransferase involved in cell wall biosynthesis